MLSSEKLSKRTLKRIKGMRFLRIVAILAGVSNQIMFAQSAEAHATHPDFTGYYVGTSTPKYMPLNNGVPTVPTRITSVVVPRLQPWAKLKMEATNGTADDPGMICQPDGFWRYTFIGNNSDFALLDGRDKITWVSGEIEIAGVIRIYLDREHPRNLKPSWNGDSIGHWDNDTLVIDSIGFNDKSWLEATMAPHTEELHVIQRLQMMPDSQILRVETKMEDRKAFTSAFTFTRYFEKRKPGGQFGPERPCNEVDNLHPYKTRRNAALQKDIERSAEVR
jgi:hypothetical protein